MRKLDTSAITGTTGMPIKSGTLTHLQDAYTETIAAIVQAQIPNYDAGKVYVLYGCVQGSTTVSVGPGLTMTLGTMSAGSVFYNGEVLLSPVQNFSDVGAIGDTLVASINAGFFTDATADPVIFTDGISRNVHQVRTVSYGIAAPGSGIANYSDFVKVFPPLAYQVANGGLWNTPQTISFTQNQIIFYGGTSVSSNVLNLNGTGAVPGAKVRLIADFTGGATLSIVQGSGQTVFTEQGTATISGGFKHIVITFLGNTGTSDLFGVTYYN